MSHYPRYILARQWHLLALVALLCISNGVSAQELQHVRDAVNARPSSGDDTEPQWVETLNNMLGCDSGAFWFLLFTSPFTVPAHLMGDDWNYRYFLPWYPYPREYPGYLVPAPEDATEDLRSVTENVRRRTFAGRLSLEGGTDFAGVGRFGGQLRLDSAYRLGILTSWNYYNERLPCGCHDQFVIGDFNIIVRFAQNEFAAMYAGGGFRMLGDRFGNDFGCNFTYGMEWFPMRPVVVGAALDAGTLGSASVFHTRATLGIVHRHWELYGGYDFLRIGNVNLQGPMAGVPLWF
jgi:hypothetical protein